MTTQAQYFRYALWSISASETYTVGTYSPGKLSVVYEISMHVFPTVPSPTTTHLIGLPEAICKKAELDIS